jgi:hypothetical protein
MDRRMFLGSVGALALTPMLPTIPEKKKWRCVEMRYIESLNRWVPYKWWMQAVITRVAVDYDLDRKLHEYGTDLTGRKVNIFYDTTMWRSMRHGFIAYVDLPECDIAGVATAYDYKITDVHSDITTKKIVTMGGYGGGMVVDYPEDKWWNDLKDYGETVAHIAQERS